MAALVTFEAVDQVGILRIANGSQNKIARADFLDLAELQKWLDVPELKGLIITGNGRHFSAGADLDYLKGFKDQPQRLADGLRKGRAVLDYLQNLPLVTVALINGICFGAGLEIALACQFRLAAENAVLALPESSLGLMPGFNGTLRLPKLIGYRKALEMIVAGRTVNAEEALSIGLVDRIVAKGAGLTPALQFIADLTENRSKHQLAAMIRSLNNAMALDEAVAKEIETRLFVELVAEQLN